MTETTFKEKFFTTTGRINRMTFFKRNMLLVLVAFVAFFVIGIVDVINGSDVDSISTTGRLLETAVTLLLVTPEYCLNVKRLHDLGKDETLAKVLAGISLFSVAYSLTLSPDALLVESAVAIALGAVSLVAFFYLLCAKGESYANGYGVAQ